MEVINVVLSGGVGSRLWPLSRKKCPKQYLNIFQGQSLFELTIRRNSEIVDKVVVVGNIDNEKLSQKVIENFGGTSSQIIETIPRNTAAAIAFSAFFAHQNDILLVTPSDHLIENDREYKKAINSAIHHAKDGYIVTFGVKPTRPETGYGYIEYEGDDVVSFREKPNMELAKTFLSSGKFLWNSGMFCFKAGVFLEELEKYNPEIYRSTKVVWEASQHNLIMDPNLSILIPDKSVDYAVMEKSDKIKVVPAEFKWNDLGSFESLYDYFTTNGYQTDSNGNMVIGTDKHTSFVGLKNAILVYTEDALLVVHKSDSQGVKSVYEEVKSAFPDLI